MFYCFIALLLTEDGQTEDDDGDDGTDTTGQTYGQTKIIVAKLRIRHLDKYYNVPVCRPRDDVSGHPR